MTETLPLTRWNYCVVLAKAVFLLLCSIIPGLRSLLRSWVKRMHRKAQSRSTTPCGDSTPPPSQSLTPFSVAFFHPYCNAGGGGERVLWVAVKAIQDKYPDVKCVVYTGDCDSSGPGIISKALSAFQIKLPRPPEFIFLRQRVWVEAATWPAFTLLGQSLGSVFLAWEALTSFMPDVFVDSMGYAFSLPLFANLAQARVASYVHYPTISTDMLARVRSRETAFNHSTAVANSVALTRGKLLYYQFFARLYRLVGSYSEKTMVNSSWTKGHIDSLWKTRSKVVYPPCNTTQFRKLPLEREGRTENSRYGSHSQVESILSIGQFRPEKDHPLQVAAFAALLNRLPQERRKMVRLVLVGGCRHADDFKRVEALQSLCEDFQISDQVDFRLNVSFEELTESLARATLGIHTMYNEHFGIGVVELMAGGAIMVAHNSGGPKMDIVVPDAAGQSTGFLARDADEYADAMEKVLIMSFENRMRLRERARSSVKKRFSDEAFSEAFLETVGDVITKPVDDRKRR